MNKKQIKLFLIMGICLFLNGCFLLSLPYQILNATLSIVGKVLEVAGKLPMPPPGVF
ncbi:MAG: hypothetical protein JW734_06060 [Candidatus Omnitrophica bacterium]|nr:hypothetical protein [Candidatus Omnitrophota bacterium]